MRFSDLGIEPEDRSPRGCELGPGCACGGTVHDPGHCEICGAKPGEVCTEDECYK